MEVSGQISRLGRFNLRENPSANRLIGRWVDTWVGLHVL